MPRIVGMTLSSPSYGSPSLPATGDMITGHEFSTPSHSYICYGLFYAHRAKTLISRVVVIITPVTSLPACPSSGLVCVPLPGYLPYALQHSLFYLLYCAVLWFFHAVAKNTPYNAILTSP